MLNIFGFAFDVDNMHLALCIAASLALVSGGLLMARRSLRIRHGALSFLVFISASFIEAIGIGFGVASLSARTNWVIAHDMKPGTVMVFPEWTTSEVQSREGQDLRWWVFAHAAVVSSSCGEQVGERREVGRPALGFSVKVIGRAARPEYRFLVAEDLEYCRRTELMTPSELAYLKRDWKRFAGRSYERNYKGRDINEDAGRDAAAILAEAKSVPTAH